jgi:hypothetical protein
MVRCRGLPPDAIQEEKTMSLLHLEVCGTVKAVALKGDIDCPDLVACIVYDTKPVMCIT